jgi:hypothetical protein
LEYIYELNETVTRCLLSQSPIPTLPYNKLRALHIQVTRPKCARDLHDAELSLQQFVLQKFRPIDCDVQQKLHSVCNEHPAGDGAWVPWVAAFKAEDWAHPMEPISKPSSKFFPK